MVDVALVFGLLAFVFYQVSNLTTGEIRVIYAKNPSCIPAPLFGIIWTIIYVGIFFSGYEAFRSDAQNDYLVPMLVLFIVNLFLNKMWTRVFFDEESPRLALAVVIGILLTGIAVSGLMWTSWLLASAILFSLYTGWVVVALVINCQWVCKSDESVLPTQMKNTHRVRQNVMMLPPKLPHRTGILKNV